jgi:hypothetical protein
MPMTNAERQARWREKRNALAKLAERPEGIAERLEGLTPDGLEAMGTVKLERLEKACHRVARFTLAARKRIARR